MVAKHVMSRCFYNLCLLKQKTQQMLSFYDFRQYSVIKASAQYELTNGFRQVAVSLCHPSR